MTDPAFRTDILLAELGPGAATFILTFRGLAFSEKRCGCLERVFQDQFGQDGHLVLSDIQGLIRQIGQSGQRRIRLAQPGCAHITHDEISLLSVLSAAQLDDGRLRDSHLCWLLKASDTTACLEPVERVANWFRQSGLWIETPVAANEAETRSAASKVFQVVGRA